MGREMGPKGSPSIPSRTLRVALYPIRHRNVACGGLCGNEKMGKWGVWILGSEGVNAGKSCGVGS